MTLRGRPHEGPRASHATVANDGHSLYPPPESTMLPALLARPMFGALLQQRRHQFLDVLPHLPVRKAAGERRRNAFVQSSAGANDDAFRRRVRTVMMEFPAGRGRLSVEHARRR
ncbi:hypothetical protein WS61_25255 [Burkholderia sp. ABCPW 11]|uniref:hypothetical protein n=1 Tax=Burkholderia sp. ABCPW 11 TaxID=1637859 RepID=UPI00075E48A1|nr:hypothetical protein [Burkholderia sp. ABCPW 11]KVD37365.1 hypothetical protein WS61_25255 [Burkholderia sp. ABCPW 11]